MIAVAKAVDQPLGLRIIGRGLSLICSQQQNKETKKLFTVYQKALAGFIRSPSSQQSTLIAAGESAVSSPTSTPTKTRSASTDIVFVEVVEDIARKRKRGQKRKQSESASEHADDIEWLAVFALRALAISPSAAVIDNVVLPITEDVSQAYIDSFDTIDDIMMYSKRLLEVKQLKPFLLTIAKILLAQWQELIQDTGWKYEHLLEFCKVCGLDFR